MKHFLFTYGTLKKGFPLHGALTYSNYIGEAKTNEHFTMYDGPNFPFLVEKKGPGAYGEVYEIDDWTLADLDRIEGHPNFYYRIKTDVIMDDKEVSVWTYVHPDKGMEHYTVIKNFKGGYTWLNY